jgi:hypothetical protein
MRELDQNLKKAFRSLGIKPGDIYECCCYHPVLCLGINYKQDEIWGVSLIDGSYPRACSILHCGIRKLSLKQAWLIKMTGPLDEETRTSIPSEKRWWREGVDLLELRVGLVGPRQKKNQDT